MASLGTSGNLHSTQYTHTHIFALRAAARPPRLQSRTQTQCRRDRGFPGHADGNFFRVGDETTSWSGPLGFFFPPRLSVLKFIGWRFTNFRKNGSTGTKFFFSISPPSIGSALSAREPRRAVDSSLLADNACELSWLIIMKNRLCLVGRRVFAYGFYDACAFSFRILSMFVFSRGVFGLRSRRRRGR